MTRLRIPTVLAVVVLGAGAATAAFAVSCGGGESPPIDAPEVGAEADPCFEGRCEQSTDPDAGVCENPGACASIGQCTDQDCVIV